MFARGLTAGLVLSIVSVPVMRRFLVTIGPTDPLTFAAVAMLLVFVALTACYIPARRALERFAARQSRVTLP